MRSSLFTTLILAALAVPAAAQQGGSAVMILDGSGSMWGLVEGRTKMDAARGAVGTILSTWRSGDSLGLMVYGHRSKNDCKDIEMVVPVGPADPGRIRAAVDGITPRGKTPLSDSLRAAAGALAGAKGRTDIILVSDGIETCGADPCAVAAELKKAQVGLSAHVIGFDVADPVAKAQLQCIARATGGVYLDARNAGGLESALARAVEATQGRKVASEAAPQPPKDPLAGKTLRAVARLAEGLDPIADPGLIWALHAPGPDKAEAGEWLQTEYGPRLAIPAKPGSYVLRVEYGSVKRDFPVTLPPGKVTDLDLVLDAGYVTSEGRIKGAESTAQNVIWEVSSGGTWIATAYDPVPKFVLPAGSYDMKLTKGNASATRAFALAAGDSINLDLNLDAGKLIAEAIYAKGGPKVTGGLAVEIRRPPAQEGEDGEWLATAYDAESKFDLPTGEYDVVVTLGEAKAKSRVRVETGRPTRVTVELGAGVLGLKAPGAEAVEVVGAEKDINGDRPHVATVYGESHNLTLPAGSYVVIATRGDQKSEAPVTITAGKRTEAVVGR